VRAGDVDHVQAAAGRLGAIHYHRTASSAGFSILPGGSHLDCIPFIKLESGCIL
jgi:hypothetical protein